MRAAAGTQHEGNHHVPIREYWTTRYTFEQSNPTLLRLLLAHDPSEMNLLSAHAIAQRGGQSGLDPGDSLPDTVHQPNSTALAHLQVHAAKRHIALDIATRSRALETADQASLANIAKSHQIPELRKAALARLTDQRHLGSATRD